MLRGMLRAKPTGLILAALAVEVMADGLGKVVILEMLGVGQVHGRLREDKAHSNQMGGRLRKIWD